jgi:hypothetical protein
VTLTCCFGKTTTQKNLSSLLIGKTPITANSQNAKTATTTSPYCQLQNASTSLKMKKESGTPKLDETLPNFIKRKHPRKGERKRNKGQGPKSKQANTEVMEPLST